MRNGRALHGDAYGGAVSPDRAERMRRVLRAVGLGSPLRPPGTNGRRAVILHLDGVSRRTLAAAARDGCVPFLQRLLESGSATLSPFLAGAPASTSAFQAGLLYGSVDDVPGYLWWDKRHNRAVRMDSSTCVAEVEGRHARRSPGLLTGGTSYSTLFTGDASPPVLNLANALSLRWNSNFRHWPLSAAAAIQGTLAFKLLGRLFLEAPQYLASGLAWSARVGRHEWEWRLFGMRLLTALPLREIATWGTVGDMAIGVPVIYTCIVDYDEVAHRRGPRHPEAIDHLQAMDRCVETVFTAAAAFPEMKYDVYVLADHGMTDSVPFSALDGRDLNAFLRAAAEGESAAMRHLSLRALGDSLPPPLGWIAHQAARVNGSVPPPGVRTVDAGDLAHLYFTDDREALPIEAITRRHARILAALRASPAIPLIAARSQHGPVALLNGRVHHLEDASDLAALSEHPLFKGRDAATLTSYIARLVNMPSSGDLVLYGNAGPGRAIAFSWEFGSHGGLAADELESFVIHRPDVAFDFSAVRVPEQLHRAFVPYRPPLPRRQDLAGDQGSADPVRRGAAANALANGDALHDVSDIAAHSGCDGEHAPPPP